MASNKPAKSIGPNYEVIIAWVALVVSVFALVITLFQTAQQCFASATGYASCQELVIGKWSKFTRRRFRPLELRFEVEFQTPVIFVSPPSNIRGPLGPHAKEYKPNPIRQGILRYLKSINPNLVRFQLPDEPKTVICHEITYLVGTPASYEASCTLNQETFDQQVRNHEMRDTLRGIRTADNESATWLGLIMALQRMEKDSRDWQAAHHRQHHPHDHINRWQDETSHKPNPYRPNDVSSLHTLTAGIQKKKKSWDIMPNDMKRPYATTTIGHMIEILAMLGIYWRVLNPEENRFRAQGNGFLVTGSNVDELGIVFTFQKVGSARFKENRIIPNDNVKELCFGYCPTIFRSIADKPGDMGTLQLASLAAIAETLTVIGCNAKTVRYFSNPSENTRYSHLFSGTFLDCPVLQEYYVNVSSVTFEMLGMVGAALQISGTTFRMLPNPSVHRWNRRSFSMRHLLYSYNRALGQAITESVQEFQAQPRSEPIRMIGSRIGAIMAAFSEAENQLGRDITTEDHALYNDTVVSALHCAIGDCDRLFNNDNVSLVMLVLRAHLEVVLELLNFRNANGLRYGGGDGELRHENEQMEHTTFDINREVKLLQFRRLDWASYGEKHTSLMEVYFFLIRLDVIKKICEESSRESERENTLYTPLRTNETNPAGTEEHKQEQRRMINEIWCVLVFRMICWLLLHDFHHMDIQVDKHELFESRLPVYIA